MSKKGSRSNVTKVKSRNSRLESGQEGTLRQRKVSAATMAKWKPISAPLKLTIMTLLEDSMSRFTGHNDDVESVLSDVRRSVSHTLRNLKAPTDDPTDFDRIDSSMATLLEEKERLDKLGENLTEAVQKCKSDVERLENEMENCTPNGTQQVHPILKVLSDGVS
ncbi:uncharacterized protein LOC101853038 isoform X2 [Aplysia californica]|uniref:Uncharacterized protein LOC101853038 isoform X2 n=1 Tax=Aplysia californica TaxID=6500 RepID=A0ABM0K6P2_APLCA|nr:uncharacterized protein LOC101853038 isoform X2 [Aplysia californica]XP_005110009.1 uncharacterized protein LOC101853038 isoform X2 [Aplysia californica]XP_005110011.1 uncharacterized protein LOC101853038 isoform X2 [Aplysia californica]